MDFKLNTPLAFSEIGKKPNQEDRICPGITDLKASDRCFVLCDGMGGHEHGEVAAQIVATNLQPLLLADAPDPDVMSTDRFKEALAKTYAELDKMPVDEGKRPGTTMTCLYLAANGAFVAHIGDSRVYQVRPGKGVVFRTSDHSLVNELLKAGELTPEEARNYPRKNIITRAMQPGLETPYRADTTILTDVCAGDYFFMCTDGILENITDEKLVDILSRDISDDAKLEAIYTECYAKTRDNFTCILVPVAEVIGEPLPTPATEQNFAAADTTAPKATVAAAAPAKAARPVKRQARPDNKSNYKTLAIILGIIAVLAVGAVIYFLCFNKPKTVVVSHGASHRTETPAPPANDTRHNDLKPVTQPDPEDVENIDPEDESRVNSVTTTDPATSGTDEANLINDALSTGPDIEAIAERAAGKVPTETQTRARKQSSQKPGAPNKNKAKK